MTTSNSSTSSYHESDLIDSWKENRSLLNTLLVLVVFYTDLTLPHYEETH